MKNLLKHNTFAKIASLIAAIAVWYMVHDHLEESRTPLKVKPNNTANTNYPD